ncbi:hypothetical protein PHMEG_00039724 [Phytophthora megakarya]|uniref:Reverse transcriptase n=1 Tax=Phytophthora megakarya TaxID=4795 RepID=A0A225UEG3_9STRA|nr:hypothetical protein PHMEG_00039724 [Phytophthora megakarya]
MIYQRMIDNALWGLVQPKGGWRSFVEKMKAAEALVKDKQAHSAEHSTKSWSESPIAKTKFAAARSDVENQDPVLMLVNEPTSDIRDHEAILPTHEKGIQSFLGALNYNIFGAALYQLKDDDFEENGDLTTARRSFDMLKQKVDEAPILRHFDRTKGVYIMLFIN